MSMLKKILLSVSLLLLMAGNVFAVAPVADDQAVTTAEDTIEQAIKLTATDGDVGDTLTYSIVVPPGFGALSGTGPDKKYTPNADWNGSDSFTFEANDGGAASNIATVTITVTPVNDAPTATSNSYSVVKGQTLTVPAPGVLVGATDVENGPLAAVLVGSPRQGALSLNADGSFSYTPRPGFYGADSFTYSAYDGALSSNPESVAISVNLPSGTNLRHTAGSQLTNPAVAPDGTIYLGSDDKKFYALNPDGTTKWSVQSGDRWYTTGGAIVGTPVATSDGRVYFVSNDKKLHALRDAGASPEPLWLHPLTFSSWLNPGGLALGSGDELYVAAGDLRKIDRNGNLLWTRVVPGGVSNGPVIGTNQLIHVASGNTLLAYDASGNNVWNYSGSGSILSLSVTLHDNLLIGTADSRLVCLSSTGVPLWTSYASEPVDSTAVTGADGTIYFGDDLGKLHAVSQNGKELWQYVSGGSPIKGAPAVGVDGSGNVVIYLFTRGSTETEVIYGKELIAIFTGATIQAVDGKGRRLWSESFIGYFGDISPILSHSGSLYAALAGHRDRAKISDPVNAVGELWSIDVGAVAAATSSWPMFGRDQFNSFNAKTFPPVVTPASIVVPATDADGSYLVSWGHTMTPSPVSYVLEESLDPTFSKLVTAYPAVLWPLNSVNITGKEREVYYYRVRATKAGYTNSSWVIGANGCRVAGATLTVPSSITVPATDADGSYTISWGASSSPEVTYLLEESRDPNFISGVTLAYRGTATSVALVNRPSTTYYYRVKATKQDYPDSGWRIGTPCNVPDISSNIRWLYVADAGTTDVTNPVLALDGTVYFGSNDNSFYAIDPATGLNKWKHLTGGAIVGTPVWSDNTVGTNTDDTIYFVSNDKNLYARNAVNGAYRWVAPLTFSTWNNPGGLALSSDGDIYVAANNLSKYSAAGTLLWSSEEVTISHGPAIDTNGWVYVSSGNQLYAFDGSGNGLWVYPHTGEIRSLSVTVDNKILIGGADNRLTCISSTSGWQWDAYASAPVDSTAVTAADGTIYFGADDNRLYAVSQLGAYQWDYLAEGDIEGAPAVGSDNVIYFFSSGDSGKLNAVDSSGAFLWSRALGGDVTGKSPLLASSASGTLYAAFAASAPAASLHAVNVASTAAAASVWPMFGRDRFNSFNAKPSPAVVSPATIIVPAADADGAFTMTWAASSTPAVDPYILETSLDPTFMTGVSVAYSGTAPSAALTGQVTGIHYYRVKAKKPGLSDSDWRIGANGCEVAVYIPLSITVPATDVDGDYSISWGASGTPDAVYVVEESQDATFVSGVTEVYGGTALTVALTGRKGGTYYYRVKATKDGFTESAWLVDTRGCAVPIEWSYAVGTATNVTNPAIAPDGTIYVGANDKMFYAVNPDGTLKWKYSTEGATLGTPAVASDGTVYFVSNDDGKNLYALTTSGVNKWSYPLSFETWGNSGGIAVGSDGDVYVAAKNLMKFDASGNPLWASVVASAEGTFTSGPVIGADGSVYVSTGKTLLAIDSNGGKVWEHLNTGAIQSISITDSGNILIGSADSRLSSVSPNGELLWRYYTSAPVSSTAVTGTGGTIYFGSDDNKLRAVDQAGKLVWEYLSEGDIKGAPAVGSDNMVYFFTLGATSKVNVVNSSGVLQWSRAIDGWLDGKSPLLSVSGRLYAGVSSTTSIANLMAIQVSSPTAASSVWPMFGRNQFNTFNAKSSTAVVGSASITVPAADADGAYTVTWSSSSTPAVASYVLETSLDPTFMTGVSVAYTGPATSAALLGQVTGIHYYRVKAKKIGFPDSDWRIGANGCDVAVFIPPSITVPATDADGNFSINWDASGTSDAVYVVEESQDATFVSGVTEVYKGTALTVALTGRVTGNYYYRVKATKTGFTDSAWRTGVNGCLGPAVVVPATIRVPANDADGRYSIIWGASGTPGAVYVVEESQDATFATGASEVYNGTDLMVELAGRVPGAYYYRVKATKVGFTESAWRLGANACVVEPVGGPVTEPPGIYINASEVFSNSKTVNLLLVNDKPFDQYRLRVDNKKWGRWVTLPTPVMKKPLLYKFSGGNGLRTIYAQFRTIDGGYSVTYPRSVIIDTVRPKGKVSVAGVDGTVLKLLLSASDLNGVSMMQFSFDGVFWTPWEAYATAKDLPWNAASGVKKVYVQFLDNAGNVSKKAKGKIVY